MSGNNPSLAEAYTPDGDCVPACRTAERVPSLEDEFLLDYCRYYLAGDFDLPMSFVPDIARRLVAFLEAEAQRRTKGRPSGSRAHAAEHVAKLMRYGLTQKQARKLAVGKFGLPPKTVAEAHRRLLRLHADELKKAAEAHRQLLIRAGVHK
jgi:hypothetical protein